ncbi:hypothetical protein SEMRO_464_G148340.1 [Seminavis robusta]|uniref:Uncharacterized protein n=1 Tax=Seminavis robusta TaxID=568900 RepID=A0A9N8DY23_9STRA|nr:hypothetical protein SEMRO_464_G148340.1 [Seminavis robusta]|eukprot:Sro464_g148340.1 n/a (155) ;mRNA; r:956-1420
MVLPFSISYEHLKRNPRPVDVFVFFFDQEAKLGYYSEMQSQKLKTPPAESKEKKNLTAKFGRVKKIVKVMLMNVGSYPSKKPSDPQLLAIWQENLLELGRQGENNLYASIDKVKSIPFDKFHVSHVLTNLKLINHRNLKLPSNTPAEELQFFNK